MHSFTEWHMFFMIIFLKMHPSVAGNFRFDQIGLGRMSHNKILPGLNLTVIIIVARTRLVMSQGARDIQVKWMSKSKTIMSIAGVLTFC